MSEITTLRKRIYVIDTNILIHDPNALYRFEEHDLYFPMVVLEELDIHKRGVTDLARAVRQVNRTLIDMLNHKNHHDIADGIPIPPCIEIPSLIPKGKVYFQTKACNETLPEALPGAKADNTILATTLGLQKEMPDRTVILVSKDINLRIKATVLGILAEDYFNDKVLDDIKRLHSGLHVLPADFWNNHSKDISSWQESGRTFYKITGPLVQTWCPYDCVVLAGDDQFQAIVKEVNNDHAILFLRQDYTVQKNAVWGVVARNLEQNFALNLLMNPDVDFITLVGQAGCGKTLLALAAGLQQTMEDKRYREIIMTRVTVPVGEDIGFLPGTEEEKMTPWMGALLDNLEVLHECGAVKSDNEAANQWRKDAAADLLQDKIKIRSLNFMRGRTFLERFIIIDEAQNLTPKQLKTLVTRAGPGTKIVCCGDLGQIDTPYLSDTSSGLTYCVDKFKHWTHSGHMTLVRGERSRLADFAAEVM